MIKPKFRTTQDWELAQSLMQPAFIRIVDKLQEFLNASSWTGDFEETQDPEPGFILVLTQTGQATQRIWLWELCFQVCFMDYPPRDPEATVVLDRSFVQMENEPELDWTGLDAKVQQVLTTFFEQLPHGADENE